MEGELSAKRAPKMSKDHNDEEQRRLGKCLQQVLSNPLVCENIASFLSLSDIKTASQVNRQFLQAMRRTQRFVQEAVLAITDKNAQKSTLEKMEYSWRTVRIDVTDSSHILEDLPRVLKSARFVCLGAPPGKIRNVRWKKDPTAARLLTTVLNSTPALSHLQIGIQFLCTDVLLLLLLLRPPVLKTLSAVVLEKEEEEALAKFLENQRSLEELTLELDFYQWLVPSIRGRCPELRKLDLTTHHFKGDVEEWRFLGSMNRLKEFRLKILVIAGVTLWRLLAFLPKNQLECLSLEGIQTIWPLFWSVDGESRLEVEFGLKTELLEGFRCLRKLSFLGSRDAVDDQLMQWLLKEFSLLEELQISRCSKLTDAGISGKTTAEWGRDASFADLRRLKTLKIVRCRGVTPNGVLASCVNVPSLTSLEYSNPPGPIVKSVVMKLMEQNPRLERLILDYRGVVSDFASRVVVGGVRLMTF